MVGHRLFGQFGYVYQTSIISLNPLGLYWLGTLEFAPQGFMFNSPLCQFGWANLAS